MTSIDPWPPTIVLENQIARLEPLSQAHAKGLSDAVVDGELWKLWYTNVPSPADMSDEIERRIALRKAGGCMPFATINPHTDQPVGMTCYLNLDADNRRLEIGSTWYRGSVQKTGFNTACKRLLLAHAFESLDCIAVEFRTHRFNAASRQAIERLGARLDGILRSHIHGRDGELRDTCVYSIIACEWPTVRRHLDARLARAVTHLPRPT